MQSPIYICTPVSKIVPYFNYVILSVVQQTDTNWKWTLIENNIKKDSVKKYFDDFFNNYPAFADFRDQIEIIHIDMDYPNVGLAKNYSIKLCGANSFDIFVQLDSDDYLTPNAIKYLREADMKYPYCNIFYGGKTNIIYDGSSNSFYKTYISAHPSYNTIYDTNPEDMAIPNTCIQQNLLCLDKFAICTYYGRSENVPYYNGFVMPECLRAYRVLPFFDILGGWTESNINDEKYIADDINIFLSYKTEICNINHLCFIKVKYENCDVMNISVKNMMSEDSINEYTDKYIKEMKEMYNQEYVKVYPKIYV